MFHFLTVLSRKGENNGVKTVRNPSKTSREEDIPGRKVLFLLAVINVSNSHMFGRLGRLKAQNGSNSDINLRNIPEYPGISLSQPHVKQA